MRTELTLEEAQKLIPECLCSEDTAHRKFIIDDSKESGLIFVSSKTFEVDKYGKPINPCSDYLSVFDQAAPCCTRPTDVILGNLFFSQKDNRYHFHITVDDPTSAAHVLLRCISTKIYIKKILQDLGALALYSHVANPRKWYEHNTWLTTSYAYIVTPFRGDVWSENDRYIHPTWESICKRFFRRAKERDEAYRMHIILLDQSKDNKSLYEPRLKSLSDRLNIAFDLHGGHVKKLNIIEGATIPRMEFFFDHFTYPNRNSTSFYGNVDDMVQVGYYTAEHIKKAEKSVSSVIDSLFCAIEDGSNLQ